MPTPPDHAPDVCVLTKLSEAFELGHRVADLLPIVDLRDAAWHQWVTTRRLVDRPETAALHEAYQAGLDSIDELDVRFDHATADITSTGA